MDYFGIVQRSFEITRRYRALWLFGFLIALLGAGGSASNGLRIVFRTEGPLPQPGMEGRDILLIVTIFGLVVLVIGILTVVVNYVAQAALIGMVGEIETGATPSVRRGFEFGWSRRALRLFGTDLVIFVPITVIGMLLLAIPLFLLIAQGDEAGTWIVPLLFVCCLLLFVLLFIPVAIVLSVLQNFYYRRIVLAGDGVFDSIRNAWQMIRANAGPVAVIWLIMFLIGLVWTVVNFLLVLGTFVLVAVPAAALQALVQSWVLAAILVLPLVIVALLALAAINALYTVFSNTVWTLTYLALPQAPAVAVGETL